MAAHGDILTTAGSCCTDVLTTTGGFCTDVLTTGRNGLCLTGSLRRNVLAAHGDVLTTTSGRCTDVLTTTGGFCTDVLTACRNGLCLTGSLRRNVLAAHGDILTTAGSCCTDVLTTCRDGLRLTCSLRADILSPHSDILTAHRYCMAFASNVGVNILTAHSDILTTRRKLFTSDVVTLGFSGHAVGSIIGSFSKRRFLQRTKPVQVGVKISSLEKFRRVIHAHSGLVDLRTCRHEIRLNDLAILKQAHLAVVAHLDLHAIAHRGIHVSNKLPHGLRVAIEGVPVETTELLGELHVSKLLFGLFLLLGHTTKAVVVRTSLSLLVLEGVVDLRHAAVIRRLPHRLRALGIRRIDRRAGHSVNVEVRLRTLHRDCLRLHTPSAGVLNGLSLRVLQGFLGVELFNGLGFLFLCGLDGLTFAVVSDPFVDCATKLCTIESLREPRSKPT